MTHPFFRANLHARQQTKLVEGVQIERVARRDGKHAVFLGDRDEVFAIDQFRRQAAERLDVNRHIGQVDLLHTQLLSQGIEQHFFGKILSPLHRWRC